MQIVFQVEADVVNGKVASLVLHLRGHNDGLVPARDRAAQNVKIAGALIRGQAANAVTLNDDGVIVVNQVGKQAAVRAGRHFQQTDVLVQPVVEAGTVEAVRADVFHQKAVLQHGKNGIIDAGKGL